MFHFAFDFGGFRVLIGFVAVLAGGSLLLSSIWPRLSDVRRLYGAAVLVLLSEIGVVAVWAATVRFDSDEIEHLHAAWLVSQGLVPFRNFWQSHSPMFWYLAAPLVEQFRSATVVFVSRAVAAMLFAMLAGAVGWVTWRVFRDRQAAVLAALLFFALAIRVEGAWLRPDQLTNLLVVLALGMVAVLSPSRSPAFVSGLLLAFALSLSPKAFLLVLVFPLATLVAATTPLRRKLDLLVFHFLGGLAGAAPLLVLLIQFGVLKSFLQSTLGLHAGFFRAANSFPAALAILGAWSATAALSRGCSLPLCLLATAFTLETLDALFQPALPYQLMLWSALACALAAPMLAGWIRTASQPPAPHPAAPETGRASDLRPRTAGLLAAASLILILMEALAPLLAFHSLARAPRDRARLDWILKTSGDEPVLLLTPVHDIYSRDATRLWVFWQYTYYLPTSLVQGDLRGFAADVHRSRPLLILARPRFGTDDLRYPLGRPEIFERLAAAGVISPLELINLRQLLQDHYEEREVYGELFYVRVR